jgi:hypothetical protein
VSSEQSVERPRSGFAPNGWNLQRTTAAQTYRLVRVVNVNSGNDKSFLALGPAQGIKTRQWKHGRGTIGRRVRLPLRVTYRVAVVAAASVLLLVGGCSKTSGELTTDKAKELLEASNLFRQQSPVVTLTDDEVQKGVSAGYWTLSEQAEHHRENRQLLLLTPQGREYFTGQPLAAKPVITLKQELSGQLLQVESVQPPDGGGTDRVVGVHVHLEIRESDSRAGGVFQRPSAH